jgi:hypothetical protein
MEDGINHASYTLSAPSDVLTFTTVAISANQFMHSRRTARLKSWIIRAEAFACVSGKTAQGRNGLKNSRPAPNGCRITGVSVLHTS